MREFTVITESSLKLTKFLEFFAFKHGLVNAIQQILALLNSDSKKVTFFRMGYWCTFGFVSEASDISSIFVPAQEGNLPNLIHYILASLEIPK